MLRSWYVAVGVLALAACERGQPAAPAITLTAGALDAHLGTVQGSGQYNLAGLIVDFALEAEQKNEEKAVGKFSVFADEGDGVTVNFTGIVTCVAIDEVKHRAWIGGVVQNNRSTDPAFDTPIQRPGHDIWFRILDLPGGDRSTFTGFEGSAGFLTSADYCAGRPWPDNNARTWPVVVGGFEIN